LKRETRNIQYLMIGFKKSAGGYLTIFSVFVMVIMLLLQMTSNAQDSGCWPIFRGNQRLTGSVSALLPDKPRLSWTFSAGSMIKSSPVACDNKIVVCASDGTIYCLDMNGKKLWQFKTSNSIEASPLILDSKIYIGNLDGTLYALELSSGKKIWEYKTEGQIMGSVNWYKTGTVTSLLVGSYDYFLHCVDARTGKVSWTYESDNYINGAAACINGQAIFGGCDGYLHLVDIATGKSAKKINVATYVAGSVAVEGTKAWVGDYDGRFSQVDLSAGVITWKWEDPQVRLPFLASPALAGNLVITGNHDKNVYCFDKNSGKKIWSVNTGNRIEASPVIAGKRVIAANMRGDLFILDIKDGKILWQYEIGSAIISNPAVCGNKIVIGAGDGIVYCFGK
jgi:eukaryotic-like serine/threonine-protein kinase